MRSYEGGYNCGSEVIWVTLLKDTLTGKPGMLKFMGSHRVGHD